MKFKVQRQIMKVYVLWHSYQDEEGRDHEMHLGIYSSHKKAEEGLTLLSSKPGFRDHPDGFEIKEGTLDRTYVTEPFGSRSLDAG